LRPCTLKAVCFDLIWLDRLTQTANYSVTNAAYGMRSAELNLGRSTM